MYAVLISCLSYGNDQNIISTISKVNYKTAVYHLKELTVMHDHACV